MKKSLFIAVIIIAALACNQSAPPPAEVSPSALPPATSQSTASPAPTSTAPLPPTATPFPGTEVSFGNLSLVIPPGLASGASGIQQPGANGEDAPTWMIYPDYIELTFNGYTLPNPSPDARIYVFPVEAYKTINPDIAKTFARVQAACCDPQNLPTPDALPRIPFFNAGQVFASNIQSLAFQNGQGVRFVTQYSQFYAVLTNTSVFYQYQGLTSDGQYYLIVTLPLSSSILPPISDPPVAPPGILMPQYGDPDADWENYYHAVAALLDTSPTAYTPTLAQLDTLIQSIIIHP